MRPPGSTTIGTTYDQRTDLRDGVLLVALGTLVLGGAAGYMIGRRRTERASNPARSFCLQLPRRA